MAAPCRGKIGFSSSDGFMMPIRSLAFTLLLAGAVHAGAFAANPCSQACQDLIGEGHAFEAKGQYQQALEKFKAAEKAAPEASLPLSSAAALLQDLSGRVEPAQAAKMREQARALATRAASMWADDPVAQETLRKLDDDGPSPLHVPGPEAEKLHVEAEVEFTQRRFAAALAKYEALMKLDPQYSAAWIGAGDCHYFQKDWVSAEAMFRRATEIEPRNAQAWRFLSDALLQQGKRGAAEAALVSGIAADPSQKPNWSKLAVLRAGAGLPLRPLGLRRLARVLPAPDANGKYTMEIDESISDKADTPDGAIPVMLAATEANLRIAAKGQPSSPYEVQLNAWRAALRTADELKAETGKVFTDPALLQIQALAKDGQLEPAILILMFRQSYRPALEAWVAAHPGGVKEFIDRYGLRP
jgi:tetratricopeptide (TPR) repeat protein